MKGKNIISFALWGTNPYYALGAIENAKLASIIYPGWTPRFYVDETVNKEHINILKDLGCEIVEEPKSDGFQGMFWRFKPLADNAIDRFIVRDGDSRLNKREADAVSEWIDSGLEFHLMRDNVQHNCTPICGGMWGATSKLIKRINYQNMLKTWLSNNSLRCINHPRGKYFWSDQSFLAECIWPLIINSHMAHERVPSNYSGNKRKFKITNEDGSFVGKGIEIK